MNGTSVLASSWRWLNDTSETCFFNRLKAVWFLSHAEIHYHMRFRHNLTTPHAMQDPRLVEALESPRAPCVCDNTELSPCHGPGAVS